MKIHKVNLRKGPGERRRFLSRSGKIASMVGALALLVLGGVGVMLGNTFAAGSYTRQKGSSNILMIGPEDYLASDYRSVAIGGTVLNSGCYRHGAFGYIIIEPSCLNEFNVGTYQVSIETATGSGSYSLTIEEMPAYSWQKGDTANLMIGPETYLNNDFTSITLGGTALGTGCYYHGATNFAIIQAECLDNYDAGTYELIIGTTGGYKSYSLTIMGMPTYTWQKGSSNNLMIGPEDYLTASVNRISIGGTTLNTDCYYHGATGYLLIESSCLESLDAGNYELYISTTSGAKKYDLVIEAESMYTYRLRFRVNGGTGTFSALSCTTSAGSCTVTISTIEPIRNGYMFRGWGDSSSATVPTYQPGDTVTLTDNKTVYAVWARITYLDWQKGSTEGLTIDGAYNNNTDTINYVSIDDSNLNSSCWSTPTPASGTIVIAASCLESLGAGAHTIRVGITDDTGNEYIYPYVVTITEADIVMLTLSLSANGGTGAPGAVSCTTNTGSCTVTVPMTIPMRSGHVFRGWSDSSNATTPTYQPGAAVTLTNSKIIYAVWEAIDDGDDGDGSDTGNNNTGGDDTGNGNDDANTDGDDSDANGANSDGGDESALAVPDTGANGRDGGNGAETVWTAAGIMTVVAASVAMLRHRGKAVRFNKK